MLTYFPPNTQPDVDALANGAAINDNGHGFAIVIADRIIVEHSMDADALIENFASARAASPEGPALFHSRFATHGVMDVSNCHPFRIGLDERTVLAHNGILPKRVRPKNGDSRSDTRVAAEDYLPSRPFGSLDTPRGRSKMTSWLGTGNKLVILTVDPAYRNQAYLLNEKLGVWDHGVWYSNSDYREVVDIDLAAGWSSWREEYLTTVDDPYETCQACLSTNAIDYEGYCVVCGTCADCGGDAEECFCYPARRSMTRAAVGGHSQ